ncbi:hypothetical protein Leryth_012027 [Lithospermum erythrorhizon]|nr:hypothetical protein Leryth_012027 [Lithospermum erythrorhizon]
MSFTGYSSIPVLKVLLVTGLGSFLALDSIDILGEQARKHLNNVVFYVFNPALVSSTLAATITMDSMKELWFMPFNILITFIIGSLFGRIVVRLTRTPTHLRGLVVGCCAGGNLGNMLLIIIPAVCKEPGSPFGDPDVCHSYGMGYVALSMAVGAIYLWTYVYNIVRISSNKTPKGAQINDTSRRSSTASLASASCSDPLLGSSDIEVSVDDPTNQLLHAISEDTYQESVTTRIKHYLGRLNNHLDLKRVFAPSTTAAITGFAVGLVAPIRRALIGETAPLRVLQDTAVLLGDGAIPALTLIVGGNLLKGLKVSGMQSSIVIGIILVRYVALPMVGVAVVRAALKYGVVHNNSLYVFVLLLQYAVPPAMNIGTITQLFGAGESECSVIMLWTYTFASLSLTFWSTLFMWMVS